MTGQVASQCGLQPNGESADGAAQPNTTDSPEQPEITETAEAHDATQQEPDSPARVVVTHRILCSSRVHQEVASIKKSLQQATERPAK